MMNKLVIYKNKNLIIMFKNCIKTGEEEILITAKYSGCISGKGFSPTGWLYTGTDSKGSGYSYEPASVQTQHFYL